MRQFLSFFLIISLLIVSSCKKYEDGPLISFRSKTKRLTKTWQLIESSHNEINNSGAFNNVTSCTFTEDGTYRYSQETTPIKIKGEGTWKFDTKKKHLEITYKQTILNVSTDRFEKWNIVRLRNNELRLTTTIDDIRYNYYYTAK